MKKLLVVILMFIVSVSFAAGKPYMAVASSGAKSASATSNMPGKAPFFLIYDDKGVLVETVANQFLEADAPGPMAVSMLSEKGVKVFVAESFPGERFVGFLKTKGVEGKTFKGTVDAAVKSLIKKK